MDYHKNSQLNKGFNLVEILLVIAIIGVGLFFVAGIYITHYKIFSNQNTSINVTSQSKIALDEITNQVREAQTIVSTCTGCGGDTTGASALVLQLWRLDSNGDPDSSAYDYITYTLASNQLVKKTVANPTSTRQNATKIIATNISILSLTYNNADPTQSSEITTTITSSSTSGSKTYTATQTGKSVLRNK